MRHSLAVGHSASLWEETWGWSGEVVCGDEDWLQTGPTSKDQLAWLRAVQVSAAELPIVGASPEAVQVCIDSWHAGFKPVFIILEDLLDSRHEEVKNAIWKLEKDCSLGVFFRWGPVLISSKSDSCMIEMNDNGLVTSTFVRTNAAGLNTASECWQLFKGPAIVVDMPGAEAEQPEQERSVSRDLFFGKGHSRPGCCGKFRVLALTLRSRTLAILDDHILSCRSKFALWHGTDDGGHRSTQISRR